MERQAEDCLALRPLIDQHFQIQQVLSVPRQVMQVENGEQQYQDSLAHF